MTKQLLALLRELPRRALEAMERRFLAGLMGK